MKTRLLTYLFLLLFSLGFSQNRDAFCLKLYTINALLQKNHYSPKALNNTFSEYLYNTFISQLDSDELIFMQHEIDSLSRYKLLLDDAIFNTDCDFLNDFIGFYKGGLERQLSLLDELKEEPFHPELDDTLRFVDKGDFYHEPKQIKNVLRKRITHRVLDRVARSGTNKDSLYQQLPLVARDLSLQEIDNLQCRIENQLNPHNGLDNYMLDLYANVFSGYFDPHSNYFNLDSRNEFFNSLTSGKLSFGLIMEMDDASAVSVSDVLTGSPAFRDKRIEKGDQLIKVQHKDNTYDVNCVNMNVVNSMFYSDTYKNLLLTFRKKSGVDYEAWLQKEMLKNYENAVFSFIIEGKKKLGYINVPTFYSNLEGNTSNVYNAFLFELNQLKHEGAKGFIIDLQNNTGGDMIQAFYMVSLFIDNGPIAVLKNRDKSFHLIYNLIGKKMFREPVVVLINGYTGSASELFAGALQDHKRAVLLGQLSYGKGSMQLLFPIDEQNPDSELLKVTTEKMFRLDGKSLQLTGIEPDIITAALLEPLFVRERDYARALEVEDLGEVHKIKNKMPASHLRAIAAGQQRIAMRPHYKEIRSLNDLLSEHMAEEHNLPLNFESVYQAITKENQLFSGFTKTIENTYPLQLSVLKKDKKTMQYTPMLETITEGNKQRVLASPDVFEAAYVLWDML